MVYHEYEKFVVFCIDKEPVWRKAARQLQIKNEERLNSTENIYERFQLQELAVREKQKIFVEAMDYVFSLKIVEHDAMKAAINTARNRRRETMQAAPPAPVIVSREVGGRPPEPAKRMPEIPKEDKNKRGNPAPRPAPKTNHVPRPPTHPRPTSSGSGKSGKSSESGGKPHKDGKGSSGAAKAASHGIVATSSGSSGNSSGAKNKSKEPTTLISNIKRLV
ncbi:hypothetical protein, conserved [Angomonas deanei]|uniref:Uncharacterized protein n=1 Tax=Angomonas deanei TaxID=59799 RepID=A0A7G2C7B9_9TRYP|nr:hypothetical protein, conserved [Angomonas deanei]